ncbi:MAG: exodeoxyribonuclease V subunit gamma, partial [Planctomycetes bacterium]|nr:exodeoxyribonuclease V subunit gamma [Planctomycetota bacterium]
VMKVASEAHIALCLDPADIDCAKPDADTLDEADLFYQTQRTFAELVEAITKSKLQLGAPIVLAEALRFSSSAALGHIEKNLFVVSDAEKTDVGKAVHIVNAPNARAEVAYIAREILRLVRHKNFRFRDIAVVASDIGSYQHYVEATFSEYGIEFFVDRPKPLSTHPVIELVNSALQAALDGFSSSDVLAYLKTHLAGIDDTEVDLLENYCLAYGVNRGDWLNDKGWSFADKRDKAFDEQAVDEIRRRAVEPLVSLRDALQGDRELKQITAADFTRAVWKLLEGLHVSKSLAKRSDDNDSGADGQFHEKFVMLFDEFCNIFADHRMNAADFHSIISEGFSQLTLKLIPSKLDQVLVGSIERSRHPDLKAVFLMGATQKCFPMPISFDAIMTDADRQTAESYEFELAQSTARQLAARQYLAYIALTRASGHLYITYPAMDDQGKSLVRSQFVDNVLSLFCDLQETNTLDIESSTGDVYSGGELESLLCQRLGRDSPQTDKVATLLGELYRCLSDEPDEILANVGWRVQYALEYDNAATLDADLAAGLVGDVLECSATRLGGFAACPYQHYARYILGIESRKLFRFEAMDLGTFYHRVLEDISRQLKKDGDDFTTVDDDRLQRLCAQRIAQIIKSDAFLSNFMSRSRHNTYIIDSAARTLSDCVLEMAQMARAGSLRQIASELRFGSRHAAENTCTFDLDGGQKVILSGCVDRLDCAEVDGENVAVIFDYKRSKRSFSWSKLYHGLDMQLAMYMLALWGGEVDGRKMDTVAGAFFVPVEMPPAAKAASDLDKQAARFQRKANGIFNGCFSQLLDADAPTGWNPYYNFARYKDGEPYSNFGTTGVLEPEQFEAVLATVWERIGDFAARIAAGQIDINPYRMARQSPCAHCDYSALCRFDWQINDYRPLEALSKKEVLEKIGGERG